MSRIGEQPIPIPSGVDVKIDGSSITVNGPLGTLSRECAASMKITRSDGILTVERPSNQREHRSLHGLTRSLIANMVTGVSEGFIKSLDLVGVGYRATQNGDGVTLSVMLSHTVDISPLPGTTIEVEGNNRINIRGADKQAVGQIAAEIRAIRPPNVYTGKGIRYANEVVRLKPGKSARRT